MARVRLSGILLYESNETSQVRFLTWSKKATYCILCIVWYTGTRGGVSGTVRSWLTVSPICGIKSAYKLTCCAYHVKYVVYILDYFGAKCPIARVWLSGYFCIRVVRRLRFDSRLGRKSNILYSVSAVCYRVFHLQGSLEQRAGVGCIAQTINCILWEKSDLLQISTHCNRCAEVQPGVAPLGL